MAPSIGNKHAEKWDKEKTLNLLDRAVACINDNCYFLAEVADEVGEYPQLFTYLTQKFENDTDVFEAIKRLYSKVERNITRKTADGKIVPALGIFILKAYHNLVETSKVQTDITTGGEKINTSPVDLSNLSTEALRKIAELKQELDGPKANE